MMALEQRATQLGMRRMHLDTANNQPGAVAFYEGLGYREIGREHLSESPRCPSR
jgi:ribosomal protein S18 acetylase RimI-like enzyme